MSTVVKYAQNAASNSILNSGNNATTTATNAVATTVQNVIRKVLDNWSKILHQFNTEVSEEIRLNIESQKKEICTQWQDRYMKQERDLRKKVDLLNELAKK